MDNRIKYMLMDELKNASQNSIYIKQLYNQLKYVQNESDFITLISQSLIAIDSARQETFDVLVERKQLGL